MPAPPGAPACEWCRGDISGYHAQTRFCSTSCRYKARYARKGAQVKARAIENYWKNREREVERSREYRQSNPDRRRTWDDLRAERMRSNPGYAPFGSTEWEALKRRHGHRCAYCDSSSQSLEMDHVIPLSRGGRHAIANILPACTSCNRRKSSMLLIEWRYRNGQGVNTTP